MNTMKYILLFYFLFFPTVGFSQNKINQKGLKYGHWKYNDPTYDFIEEGSYRIVPISFYDTINSDLPYSDNGNGHGHFGVRYKRHWAIAYFHAVSGDSISVQDGIWNMYDSKTRTLTQSVLWTNGISLWTKKFDEEGNVTNYNYEDYENDSGVYITYIDKHIFKKEFSPLTIITTLSSNIIRGKICQFQTQNPVLKLILFQSQVVNNLSALLLTKK